MSIKVMLVDDSTIIRGLISRALTKHDGIEIVATAGNGLMAINSAKAYQPDVIILDIEMPQMDGITALPKILEASPNSRVIMASTLTQSNASISLKAMELGAVDYIPKPSSTGDSHGLEEFYRDLYAKVKALGQSALPHARPVTPTTAASVPYDVTLDTRLLYGKFDAVAIISSTGGPQALQHVFQALHSKLLHVPIFITQHMPATFTTLLAANIAKKLGRHCAEGTHGEIVKPGGVYLAPGDHHMLAKRKGDDITIEINQDPPENFCRPAADPMLRSLSDIYKSKLLVVVLTGMGQDGLLGAKVVVQNGGFVIAQNKETSVVYGMPKAVADEKLCTKILPLDEIAPYLIKTVMK